MDIQRMLNLVENGFGLTTSKYDPDTLLEFNNTIKDTVIDETEEYEGFMYIRFHQYAWYDEYDCDKHEFETIQKINDL